MNHVIKQSIDIDALEKKGAIRRVYILDGKQELGLEYLILINDDSYRFRPLRLHPRWILLALYFLVSTVICLGIAVPAVKSNRYDLISALLMFPVGGLVIGFLMYYFERQKILRILKLKN